MSDVFISYARVDLPIAQRVAAALEAQGFSVWYDTALVPGQKFTQVIQRQLDEARCVVVLWSQASSNSDWVSDEAREAQRRGVLVPAIVHAGAQPPLGFRGLQTADLSGWLGGGADSAFSTFSAAIHGLVGSTPAPQPAPPALSPPTPPAPPPGPPAPPPAPQPGWSLGKKLGLGAGAVLAVGVIGQLLGNEPAPAPSPSPVPAPMPMPSPAQPAAANTLAVSWRDRDLGYNGTITWAGGPQAYATIDVFDLGANQAPLGRQQVQLGVLWQNPGRVTLQGSVPTNGHASDRGPHAHNINLVFQRAAANLPWTFVQNCSALSGPCW